MEEKRNVLVESARIARGEIHDLATIDTLDLDALILPGGYGAAKNLSDYAYKGSEMEVLPAVADAIRNFYTAGKPLGFICISPVIAARVLGSEQVEVTIGNDTTNAEAIENSERRMSTARSRISIQARKEKCSALLHTCWAPLSVKSPKA